ncbi:MAG: hypothetical protein R3C03_00090 [Pirellulaceae bacterium]
MSVAGGTWNHNAGASINGGDQLTFTNSTINLNNAFTTDFANVRLTNTTVNGPETWTNASGTTLLLEESTFNSAVVNNGLIRQERTNLSRNNWLNNGLTNNASGEVEIVYDGSAAVHHFSFLNVDGNIDNFGSIALQSRRVNTGYQGFSFLQQSNGTLTNHAGAIIEARNAGVGIPGNNYVRTDSLINNGTIRNNNPAPFVFDRANAIYTNNGLIDAAAQYIHFNDLGSFTNSASGSITGQHFYLYGTSNSSGTVNNAGSINLTAGGLTLLDLAQIDNSGTINVSGGDINVSNYSVFNNAGSIQSASGRSMSVAGGTWNHNVGASINGGDQLTFTNSTINLNTAFTTDFANVRLTNATVNGPATWTNASGSTLLLEESTFNSAVVNNGLMRQSGTNNTRTNWLNSGLTNNVSGEVEITYKGTAATHRDSRLNIDGSVENFGSITLQSQRLNASYIGDSHLIQTNGTLTNHSGALIQAIANTGGTPGRNYISTDSLINNGTIRNNSGGQLIFNRAGSSISNSGLMHAEAGDIVISSASTFVNNSSGTLLLTGGNLVVNANSFLNEGLISGNQSLIFSGGAELINSGTLSPGTSPGISRHWNVQLLADSTLMIEIADWLQGTEYDWLNINGTAEIDGTLSGLTSQRLHPDAADTIIVEDIAQRILRERI